MSTIPVNQDNVDEHAVQDHQISETENNTSTENNTMDDHEKWLRYKNV
jgi:hypothetical protein